MKEAVAFMPPYIYNLARKAADEIVEVTCIIADGGDLIRVVDRLASPSLFISAVLMRHSQTTF
jgi:hypothetical protein